MSNRSITLSRVIVTAKVRDYHQLAKTRLTLSVVLSAAFGYWLAAPALGEYSGLLALVIGGFLVVSSSNGLNQVIEKNYDKLMIRTNNRPVAAGRMTISEAVIFCSITGISGVYILGTYLNELSGLLGIIALVSYAFIYTPLKRVTPFAVFVGAIPGAIPPLLGWAAATGSIGAGAIALFTIQFFWQFPHFWSIAWILDEDYQRAGYRLLPSKTGKDKRTAVFMIWYTFILIPLSIVPYTMGISGMTSMIIAVLAGTLFLFQGIKLYRTCETKDAKRLMFYSIIYNPLILLAFLIDKV